MELFYLNLIEVTIEDFYIDWNGREDKILSKSFQS